MMKITKLLTLVFVAAGMLLAIVPGGLLHAQGSEQTGQIVITIRLPADAILMIGDHKTAATGDVRTFETPRLPMGRHYAYTLKATSGGKEVARKIYVAHGMENGFDLRAEFLPGDTDQVSPRHFTASGSQGADITINWGASLRTVEQALATQPVDVRRLPK